MIIEGDEFDKLKSILKSSQMKISEQDVLLNFGGCYISAYSILGKICHRCAIVQLNFWISTSKIVLGVSPCTTQLLLCPKVWLSY